MASMSKYGSSVAEHKLSCFLILDAELVLIIKSDEKQTIEKLIPRIFGSDSLGN